MKGIYSITCNITGIVYIGSTVIDFKKRWRKHKQRLRHNYHENSYLQNTWNKYGENNFAFQILEDLSNESDLVIKEREAHWLDKHFPKGRDYCFNLSDHTSGGNTIKDEKTRRKLSESIKASYTPELRALRSKQGKARSNEAAMSIKETMKTTKWKQAHLEGVRKLVKNPEWLKKMRDINKHRQVPVCTNRNETFESVTEAAKQTGSFRSAIRACINGKIKSSMGRKWSYV